MSATIGGFLAVRNGDSLDYCWREAIQSMLPICDQIVVSESESTDGTREALDEWAAKEPKLKVVSYPWTDPVADTAWWPTWLNHPREHLTTDYAIYLDADELFHENSYERIRRAADRGESLYCHRYNFWRDAQSLIPEGKCCGSKVIRCGPSNLFFPSDYPDPRAAEISRLAKESQVEIMHYGFLRHRDAFFRKARVVQRIWSGSYDPRLAAQEQQFGNWMQAYGVAEWVNNLPPFRGTHPALINDWIKERWYWVTTQDLMDKWKPILDRSRHIFTWTGDGELSYLAECASKATWAVEIGSYMGRSAKVMLTANPTLHLWCVDKFEVAGTLECCQHFLAPEIAQSRCELIKGDVMQAAGMLEHMRGKLDLVFSDDGHDESDVVNDINHFLPLIRNGGMMVGHDLDQNPDNGVTKAVKRLLPQFVEPVSRVWSYTKP